MGVDPNIERTKIERGVELSDAELDAAANWLRNHPNMRSFGSAPGCTSYIQRKMGISYTHAMRIMEYLEGDVITPADAKGERQMIRITEIPSKRK